jgi:hypothetical protein
MTTTNYVFQELLWWLVLLALAGALMASVLAGYLGGA